MEMWSEFRFARFKENGRESADAKAHFNVFERLDLGHGASKS